METWEEGIKEFDEDLKRRMKVIWRHEFTGFNMDRPILLRRAMGYIDRSNGPVWRNWIREWRIRNNEWENQKERERYAERKKLTGFGRKVEYSKLKVYQDRYRENHRIEIRLKMRLRSKVQGEKGCGSASVQPAPP